MIKYLTVDEIQAVKVDTAEAETTINISRMEKEAEIYSSDNTMITRICKAMRKAPDMWKCWEASRDKGGNVTGYFFSAPKKAISFRGGNKREVSDEARQAASERFRKMWQDQKDEEEDDEE